MRIRRENMRKKTINDKNINSNDKTQNSIQMLSKETPFSKESPLLNF